VFSVIIKIFKTKICWRSIYLIFVFLCIFHTLLNENPLFVEGENFLGQTSSTTECKNAIQFNWLFINRRLAFPQPTEVLLLDAGATNIVYRSMMCVGSRNFFYVVSAAFCNLVLFAVITFCGRLCLITVHCAVKTTRHPIQIQDTFSIGHTTLDSDMLTYFAFFYFLLFPPQSICLQGARKRVKTAAERSKIKIEIQLAIAMFECIFNSLRTFSRGNLVGAIVWLTWDIIPSLCRGQKINFEAQAPTVCLFTDELSWQIGD